MATTLAPAPHPTRRAATTTPACGQPRRLGLDSHPYSTNPLVVAEVARAVADAEQRLADTFCDWSLLSFHARPVALKFAVGDLVIVYLAEKVRAEIWLDGLSKMLDISKPDLRQLIQRRADIVTNIRELWQRRHAETESEVLSWIL